MAETKITINNCYGLFTTGEPIEYNPLSNNKFINDYVLIYIIPETIREEIEDVVIGTHVTNLVDNYICPRSGDSVLLLYDPDEDGALDEAKERVYLWMRRFIAWLYSSYKRYGKLIDLFASKESNLLDQIAGSATTTDRFNDTPQDTTNPESDSYLTTYGKNVVETATDGATMMARLSEVRAQLSNIFENWLEDFRREFRIL